MQVKIEDKSSVKKVLSFEIPKENVGKKLDRAYKALKKNTNIKGFRKGKIPRKVLENRFSKDVHADVAPRLIQEAFVEAIKEHDLNIVGTPQMDPPELEPEKPYVFDLTIEVIPELDDIEFEGIELEKIKYEVTEDDIDGQIRMIQKTMAKKETVKKKRPVKEDDFVLIDYEGYVDGNPFDNTPKIENYVMKMGQETLPKEFSEKLSGTIPVQDLEIEVAYAEDHFDKNLKGRNVIYKVKLKEILEEILPEVNDDLVKGLGKFETLEDVKKSITDNLEKGYDQRGKHEMAEQIFQNLLGKYEFEVPEALIEGELNGIIMEAEQAYTANNTTLEEAGLSKEAIRTRYRAVAEKQARRHLILDKVIRQSKLKLTDEELETSYEKMSKRMNASVDAVKKYFKNDSEQLEYYKHTQLEKKAVDLIIEKGNITEVAPKAAKEEKNTGKHDEQPT